MLRRHPAISLGQRSIIARRCVWRAPSTTPKAWPASPAIWLLWPDREDWPAAEALAREALPLSEAVHRQELVANDNRVLAKAVVRQGEAAQALPHAQRAVAMYSRLGHPSLAEAQAILAECEAALGEEAS